MTTTPPTTEFDTILQLNSVNGTNKAIPTLKFNNNVTTSITSDNNGNVKLTSNSLILDDPSTTEHETKITSKDHQYLMIGAKTLELNTDKTNEQGSVTTFNVKLTNSADKELTLEGGLVVKNGSYNPVKLTNSANNQLTLDSDLKLVDGKHIELSTNESSLIKIQPGMDKKGSEATAPIGVKFDCDAQFTVTSSTSTDTIRISELYTTYSQIPDLEKVVSSLCRRVYAMKHNATPPTDSSTPNEGGEFDADSERISQYACLNLEVHEQQTNV